MAQPETFDYTQSGFDAFLSRSIDNLSQVNLNSPGPVSTAISYDRAQVTGSLGDTLRIGKIYLNGADENITLNDGNTDRFLLGRDDNGF